MPNTIVQFDTPEELGIVLGVLSEAEVGLVAPNEAGYVVSLGAEPWNHQITVSQACVGIYRIEGRDGDGATQAVGYVYIKADDTNTYIATSDFLTALAARNLDNLLANVADLPDDTVTAINADATQTTARNNAATAATQATTAATQSTTAAAQATTAATQSSVAATQATTAATQSTTAANEVVKIQRAATAVTPGEPQQRHLETAAGATTQVIYEVHDGDAP